MSVEISSLTNRQWVQVRAALKFWKAIAEVSRQHPSEHPGVSEEFTEHGPMNLSEIDELLAGLPPLGWLTAHKLANAYGMNADTVKQYIQKLGIEPDMWVHNTRVFKVETLLPVVEEIERNGYKARA